MGGEGEHAVQHSVECVAPAHQVDQSLGIVEHAPCIVPAVAFGKCIAPLEGVEVRCELAVFQFAPHQVVLLVEKVPVVQSTLGIDLYLVGWFAQGFSQLVDAPIVESVFQRAGCTFAYFVAWHIAQSVVGIPFAATAGGVLQLCIGTMRDCRPKALYVVAAIDDATEYEYEIYEDNDIVDETMYRSKLEKDNDKPIGNAQKMSCTLYCGKEYIFYIKENGKITPYRIINTAGDYVTSEDAFFYMIEVGGTTKKLWRRTPYYSHEKQEEEPTIPETDQDKLVGTWYNENLDGTTLYKSHVTFNADSTWSCVQYANMEELTNSVSDGLYATSEGKWELLKHFDNDGTDQGFYYLYVGNVYQAYFEGFGTSSFKGYKTWIDRNGEAYEKIAMTIEFDESGTTMKIKNHRLHEWFVNRDNADEERSVTLPFNYEVTYTKQE